MEFRRVLFRSIDALPVDKRAQMGLGMSFQRPPALEGVTVEAFTAAIGSSALLESEASALDFNGFAERDVNAGFSGGEINRWEILKQIGSAHVLTPVTNENIV